MIVALLADLTILPAILVMAKPFGPEAQLQAKVEGD
jgi:uncharacterized membrane protein YdfJ with MMPL/SSD domain